MNNGVICIDDHIVIEFKFCIFHIRPPVPYAHRSQAPVSKIRQWNRTRGDVYGNIRKTISEQGYGYVPFFDTKPTLPSLSLPTFFSSSAPTLNTHPDAHDLDLSEKQTTSVVSQSDAPQNGTQVIVEPGEYHDDLSSSNQTTLQKVDEQTAVPIPTNIKVSPVASDDFAVS